MSRRADRNAVTLCGGARGRVCAHCGRVRGRWRCKVRTCPSYARTWALDWRIVLLENLIAYGGNAVMYVLTPPGVDRLPWDRAKCTHPAGVTCNGKHGCVVQAWPRREWNATFQRRLSRILESAQEATKRETGQRAFILAIGKEAQKRGPAHAHFIVGVESSADKRAAKAFRGHLERLSKQPRYEFGHVNGKFVKPKPAREVAAYLSSYFVAGRGHKAPLTESVQNGELPVLPLYVSRRLTMLTKTTMRNKRRQRHLWACTSMGLPLPKWCEDEEARTAVLALALRVTERLALVGGAAEP
jgi:hypothetical protein